MKKRGIADTNINPGLQIILNKALDENYISMQEILYLLKLKSEADIGRLFEVARELRNKYFQDKIFLYGFIYFSTWCRNNCNFCYYRKSNTTTQRYRKNEDEIISVAQELANSGVHLLDLTMGEDPIYYNRKTGFNNLIKLVNEIKQATNLPVMVSPGAIGERTLRDFAASGADWYACYQETHNKELFSKLRPNQNYEQRYASKTLAINSGLLVEEGILTGVGESEQDIVNSIYNMKRLGAHQVRVMSFVPQAGIPMENWPTPNRVEEYKIIAVLRLLFPDRLIPASLDVDGIDGLQARLNAGANVVTSIIPPQTGLAGVAQSSKGINEGYRTVQGVKPILKKMGLRVAELKEFTDWLDVEKKSLRQTLLPIKIGV